MKLFLAFWFVFPVLVPFYLMGGQRSAPQLAGTAPMSLKAESGVPQIADYWMVLLMAGVFATHGLLLSRRLVPVVVAFAGFVGYAVLVNLVWTVMFRDSDLPFVRSSLFYAYDLILLMVFAVLYSRYGDELLRVTLYGLAASVLLQVLLSPFALDKSSLRQALFFNNPNQLGYFALLAGTIFYLGTLKLRLNTTLQVLFYCGIAYLAALALSKAALLGLGFLLLLVLCRRASVFVVIAIVLGATLFTVGEGTGVWEKITRRLESESTDDSFGKRGYDRIVNHPEYLLFGAGEGAHYRFISEHPGEMHSTWGTLVFSYGAIGAGLFLCGLVYLLRGVQVQAGLALLPVFLYGSAHQGLRFSFFWVLLAFLCCLKESARTCDEPETRYAGSLAVDQGISA